MDEGSGNVVAVVESRVCRMRRRSRIYGNDRRWRGMKSV